MSSIYSPEEDSYLLESVLERQLSKMIKKNSNLTLLEIGVGSGIQLMAVSNSGVKKENILGVDINLEAVKHCKNLGFNCIKSDLFSSVNGKFDLIIFNPPYLPEEKNEPEDSKLITTGGKTGSEVINKFLIESKKHLAKDGKIFLLVSSLSKGIKWNNYKKRLISKKKIFFEELKVYEVKI